MREEQRGKKKRRKGEEGKGNVPRHIIHRIRKRLSEFIPAFPTRITRIGGFVAYVVTCTTTQRSITSASHSTSPAAPAKKNEREGEEVERKKTRR